MKVAVYFDIDDTLLNNYIAFKKTMCTTFPKQGLSDQQLKELYRKFRNSNDAIYQRYQSNQPMSKDNNCTRWKQVTKELNERCDTNLLAKLDDMYHSNQKRQVLAEEYVQLFSFLLQHKIHFGVLTNGVTKTQARKIEQLGLQNYIAEESIFISEELNDAKPNFSCFKKVEQHLPQAIDTLIYLGDSFKNDIAPLVNTRWQPIWLNRFNEEVEQDGFIEVQNEEEATRTLKNLIRNCIS